MERRKLWALVVACPLALGASFAAASETMGVGTSSNNNTEPPPPPVYTETGFMLMRAGLDAEPLAALGLSATEVGAVVSAAEAHIANAPTALEDADEAYEDAKLSYDRLRSIVRKGNATSAQITQCQADCATAESAEQAVEAVLDGIYEAGADVLSVADQATLATIRGNRDQKLDVYYLVEDRTDREWMDLHDAVDTRRISQRYGEAFPASTVQYLAAVEGASPVATAKVNYETYLASVQTAWNQEVSD